MFLKNKTNKLMIKNILYIFSTQNRFKILINNNINLDLNKDRMR